MELNKEVALFVRDLFSLLDRGRVHALVRCILQAIGGYTHMPLSHRWMHMPMRSVADRTKRGKWSCLSLSLISSKWLLTTSILSRSIFRFHIPSPASLPINLPSFSGTAPPH